MPDISTINNVAVADISKLDSVTFAHGQKVNNQDVSLVTDAHVLISTHPASASATLDITSGIDSTYDVYEFHMVNLHPGEDSRYPAFRASIDGGSNYGVETTTTYVRAYHNENDGDEAVGYIDGYDRYEFTGDIYIAEDTGADNDQAMSGIMTLYAPLSAYVKHFTIETNTSNGGNQQAHQTIGGYVNTTSAVNAIQFKFSSGNIDSGVIKMYGLAKS